MIKKIWYELIGVLLELGRRGRYDLLRETTHPHVEMG